MSTLSVLSECEVPITKGTLGIRFKVSMHETLVATCVRMVGFLHVTCSDRTASYFIFTFPSDRQGVLAHRKSNG